MLRAPFLFDSFRHPREFTTRAFDPASHLFLLRAIHLRQRLAQPAVGTLHDGQCHSQIGNLFRSIAPAWTPRIARLSDDGGNDPSAVFWAEGSLLKKTAAHALSCI